MHGEPALAADFTHLPYADPAARSGGRLRVGAIGGFDNLNPFTLGGSPVWPVRELVFESLMARSLDEPFTLYGLLAEAVATPEDRSFVAFRLRPEARFSDGSPVTVEDLIWSMETLREHGLPSHRSYYSQISKVERLGPRSVKFYFEKADRELPLLIGFMPILSKRFWERAEAEGAGFADSGLLAPIGSGPYRITEVDPARRVTFLRNPDYWGADLPVQTGRHQLGRIDYLYYRDSATLWESFKAGDLDLYQETDPMRWRDQYDFPAVRSGAVARREVAIRRPSGMEGFVFNTRREIFADRRVRRALALAFDFDWVNRTYFAGRMTPVLSFFSGSPLGFRDRLGEREKALLAPFAADLPPETLQAGWRPPRYKTAQEYRQGLLKARALLESAGWRVEGQTLRNDDGEPFRFEILIDRRHHERIARSFADNLEWLGVQAKVRLVDAAQRAERLREYDYDMIVFRWLLSLSPGQELRYYFGSTGRTTPGTRNYMGVAEPAVDAMIDAILGAKDRESFEAAVRAHDRVLSSGVFVIPWGWRDVDWIAMDAGLRLPERGHLYGFTRDVLWRASDEAPARE